MKRIEALQSVDESVQRLVEGLRAHGELEDTYIFFVSDNGLLLGEHALGGKNVLYREALEVPMLVRVPDSPAGTVSDLPVTLVDLAPTIADLAGARPRRRLDGASFRPVLQGRRQSWRDTQLILAGTHRRDVDGVKARGVRTARYTYTVRSASGAEQLFDRRRDPFEMHNLARDPAHRTVLVELRARTVALADCAGADCRRRWATDYATDDRRPH